MGYPQAAPDTFLRTNPYMHIHTHGDGGVHAHSPLSWASALSSKSVVHWQQGMGGAYSTADSRTERQGEIKKQKQSTKKTWMQEKLEVPI
jgi:hypothetical protein